jgi:uncharacterized protein YkwD
MLASLARTTRRPTRVALLVFLASTALTGVLLPAPATAADTWYASVRSACPGNGPSTMVCYHRRVRALAHVVKLRRNRRLDRSAALKATRIVRCRQHRHNPCGDAWVRPFYTARYVAAGGSAVVGENLAWGWSTAWTAFDALMHSPSHRANILDPDFRDVGVRVTARSPWGRLWVIHYGRRG